MFGNKRRKAEQAAAEQAEQTRQRQAEAFETGLHGTVDEFHRAYEQAREDGKVTSLTKLRAGAIQALLEEGRPEKIQLVLSNHRDEYDGSIPRMLMSLTKGRDSEQAVANVNLALDKLSGQKKQEMLDGALRKHIAYDGDDFNRNDEVFTNVLLQAGADANGYAGRTFALAIAFRSPLTVKMLHAHGGSFEDARLIMQVENWKDNPYKRRCEEKLLSYQGHEKRDTVEELRQNLDDVTRRLKEAEARLDELQPRRKPAPPLVP
jgi:predicted RNase H-like HicB family nuclease